MNQPRVIWLRPRIIGRPSWFYRVAPKDYWKFQIMGRAADILTAGVLLVIFGEIITLSAYLVVRWLQP